VHKLMFDLLQSAPSDGVNASIAPEALSGDFYKGHIFWDAEVWMFPALLAQHPEAAKQMLEYRFSHLEQAKAQAKKQNCSGADFPWESAASGNETVSGVFSKGRHVTGGVAYAAWQYWVATNDKQWLETRGWPLISNIADYFATCAQKNATGGFDIADVTGPDELNPNVKNNTYTNAMAKNALTHATEAAKILGKPANTNWKTVADKLVLPKNAEGIYLRCEGDNGKKGTKQADGELLLWPAQLAGADAKTFDFHKVRPIKNGPAMTDSVHALIAARLGRSDEAETEFRDSYRPFMRGPFLLFSEKRSMDRCVFTTACGGVLQSVLYGFGSVDNVKNPVALPKSWKKLTIQGVMKGGKRYTVTTTPEGRTEMVN
jgi:protein-glucosylgalactosylhydroxylysine glucosidase